MFSRPAGPRIVGPAPLEDRPVVRRAIEHDVATCGQRPQGGGIERRGGTRGRRHEQRPGRRVGDAVLAEQAQPVDVERAHRRSDVLGAEDPEGVGRRRKLGDDLRGGQRAQVGARRHA